MAKFMYLHIFKYRHIHMDKTKVSQNNIYAYIYYSWY